MLENNQILGKPPKTGVVNSQEVDGIGSPALYLPASPGTPDSLVLFEIAFTSDTTQSGIIATYDARLAAAIAKAELLDLFIRDSGKTLSGAFGITEPPGPYNYHIAGFTDPTNTPYSGAHHPTIANPVSSGVPDPGSNNGLWWLVIGLGPFTPIVLAGKAIVPIPIVPINPLTIPRSDEQPIGGTESGEFFQRKVRELPPGTRAS